MTQFPDLKNAKIIAIDTETYDPELLEAGPGWGRGRGHIVGVSVAVEGHSWYFPMRHEGGGNLPMDKVLAWLDDNICNTPHVPKVFANAQYDVGWLQHEGIPVSGRIHDVQLAEPLINENSRSYSLNSLAEKYLQSKKHEDAMYEELHRRYGGRKGRSQAGNIWRAEASLVEQYAKVDAELTLQILPHQLRILRDEGLREVYDLECKLVKLLIDMRMRGVRVDVEKAQRVYDEFDERVNKMQRKLGDVNVAASASLAEYCDKRKLVYPYTDKGAPSFTGPWLREHLPEVAEIRRLTKAKDTFLKGYILTKHANGRLHGQFNQLRSDDYGTVSGRLSASSPNLQNIPARDEEIGPLIRSMFLPDEGDILVSQDWSQIEFRMFVHYAKDEGLIAEYQKPGTDFHTTVANMFGNMIPRKIIKNFNFMLLYGGGVGKLTMMLMDNLSEDEASTLLKALLKDMPMIEINQDDDLYTQLAKTLFEAYKQKFPAAKVLAARATNVAEGRGFVKTLLGRRARFNTWIPRKFGPRVEGLPYDEAVKIYGAQLKRDKTHKALNAILQGSAADIMKTAMVRMIEDGVTDVLGPPLLTVHDELVWSVPQDKEGLEAIDHAKWIMCNCMGDLLAVPLAVDDERGPNWGEVK